MEWMGFTDILETNTFLVGRYWDLNPLLHRYSFWPINNRQLLKTLWEKEKLLVTSNFSFSHNVFYSIRYCIPFFHILDIVSLCSEFRYKQWQNTFETGSKVTLYNDIFTRVYSKPIDRDISHCYDFNATRILQRNHWPAPVAQSVGHRTWE